MSAGSPSISTGLETAALERGELRLEISLRPFSFTLRRGGRRLVRAGELWVADGQIHDRFIKLTEGVLTHEELVPAERAQRATVAGTSEDGLELAVALRGGRQARLRVALPDHRRVAFEVEADGEPLRLALEWDRRSEERFVGLGGRAGTQVEPGGGD